MAKISKKQKLPNVKQIIKESHDLVIPTEHYQAKVNKVADTLLNLIQAEVAKYPEIKRIETGGSFRKGTWIAWPEMDIDVYLVFAHNVSRKQFREIAIDVGKKALKDYNPYLKFSEHPYVEANLEKNILANVVPCYEVLESGKWKSSTDRSHFHTERITKLFNKRMKNEVRFLKAFLKANNLYGAQIAKNGFSGYVSEVLIAHFKSFENVIKTFATIKPHYTIGHVTKEFNSMIIITDLIDSNRNLAAAISDENIVKFILTCRSFLKNPTVDFFDKHNMKKNRKKTLATKYWSHMLVIKFGFVKRPPDTIWGQTKKSTAKLVNYLRRDGFTILRYGTHVELAEKLGYLFVLLDSITIPPVYEQYGPKFDRRVDLGTYVKKSLEDKTEMMWVDPQGRLVALKKRRYTTVDAYTRRLLRKNDKTETMMLPIDQTILPKVWIGKGELKGAAKEAAEELITTDTTIIRLS